MCGVLVVRLLKREGGGAAYCPLCQDTGINEILRQVKFVIITPSLIKISFLGTLQTQSFLSVETSEKYQSRRYLEHYRPR